MESDFENDLTDLENENSVDKHLTNSEEYEEQSKSNDKKNENIEENLNPIMTLKNIVKKKRNKNTKEKNKKIVAMKTTQKPDENEKKVETILDFAKLNLLDNAEKKFVDRKSTSKRSAKCIEDDEKIESKPKRQSTSKQAKLLAKELNSNLNITEKNDKAGKNISVGKSKLIKLFNKRSEKTVADTPEYKKNLDEKDSSRSSSITCSDENSSKDSIENINKSKTTDVKDKKASYNVNKSDKKINLSMRSITESIEPTEYRKSPKVTTETNLNKMLSSTPISNDVQRKLNITHYSEISEIVSLPTNMKPPTKENLTNVSKEDDNNSSSNTDHIDNEDKEFNEVQTKELLEDIELAHKLLKKKDGKTHNIRMKKNKRKSVKKTNRTKE